MNTHTRLGSGKSAFQRGADVFATVMAGVTTFILGPQIVKLTLNTALSYGDAQFGYGWAGLLTPVWWLACIAATFGFSQMAIAISLRLALAKIAGRLFAN